MSNDLLGPAHLAHLPGAPFSDPEVDEAVAALRGDLGWHIAPVRTETVELDVMACDPVLRLPTRHLVSVDEIRNTSTTDVIVDTSYKVSLPLNRVRRYSWPSGYGAVEVDMTHGFTECPPELRPILAQMIVRSRGGVIVQESTGPFSSSYSSTADDDRTYDTLCRLSVRNSWPARL